jgi:hypothetical protein
LLAPFAGRWIFDFDKTHSSVGNAGTADEAITLGDLHPDINITGDVVLYADDMFDGQISSEYRLFAMHQHGDKVCGKARFHEDRFDPGDMSKCYVRLTLNDDTLQMEIRMQDGWPADNDPDLSDSLAVESGSIEECDANNPGTDWSDWMTYVFTRKP